MAKTTLEFTVRITYGHCEDIKVIRTSARQILQIELNRADLNFNNNWSELELIEATKVEVLDD